MGPGPPAVTPVGGPYLCLSFPLQIGRDSSPRPFRVQEFRADDDRLAARALMGLTTREPVARQAPLVDLDFHRRVVDAILKSTTDAILVVSLDGRIVDCNQRFVDTWGIPSEVMATGLSSAAVAFVRDQLADGAEFE